MVSKRRSRSRFLRPGRAFCAALAAYAVFSGIFLARGAETPAETDPQAFSRLYFGLQPPIDREIERRVELAEELLQDGRFAEAAPLVAERLTAEVDHVGADGVSLKRRLLDKVLGAKPSDLGVLRSVLKGQYRRAADEALTDRQWRRVVASYPPELFGVESLEALARAEADVGAYASAALTLRRAATLSQSDGDREESRRLAAAEAVSRLRLGERVSPDPSTGERAAEWVDATANVAAAIAARSAPQAWLSSGGDAKRLAQAPGAAPAPWRAWHAVVDDEEELDDPSDAGNAAAASETVATGGVLVTNTRDRLVALAAKSGRRLWETPFPADSQAWRRVAVATDISTDTRLVFAITPSSTSEYDASAALRRQYGDSLFTGEESTLPANCLAAYDIATGGKLRWRIDGADGKGAAPGTRFLGAPAILDDRLFVLGESEQVVRLLEVDASTGEVVWSQPLVQCQRMPSASALTIAVSPTLGEGLVYCPTGRGAVAAVDPLRRRLEWISYLTIDEEDARPSQQLGWGAMGDPERWEADAAGWRQCRAVEHDGRLLVASPALPSLQSFDAATGALQWRHELLEAMYLGGVVDGAVLAIESSRVSAWRVADGQSLWKVNLPADEVPAGEPLLVGRALLLPLRSGRLATLDIASIETSPQWRVENLDVNPLAEAPRLGNLLYHDGAILSRSATTLECFPQPASLSDSQRKAVGALATDATPAGVLEDLRAAIGTRPGDRQLAELLAVTLLRSAKADPAAAEGAGAELPRLVAGRRAAAYAATLRLEGALARGDSQAAAEEVRTLSADRAGQVLLQPEPGLAVVAARFAANRAGRAGADLEGITARKDLPAPTQQSAGPSTPGNRLANSPWTTQQVATRVDSFPATAARGRGGMRMRQERSARRRLVTPVGAASTPWQWAYESYGGEWRLVASSGLGERVFAEAVPGEPWSPGPDVAGVIGAPGDRAWGDWLALKLDAGYFVGHIDRGVVWETVSAEAPEWPASVAAFDAAEAPVAIGPWGVVSVAGASVRCRELQSGNLVWRRDTQGLGGEALRVLTVGDEIYVIGSKEKGERLSGWSGESRGAWSPPKPRTWRGAAGGMLLVEERAAGKRRFRVVPMDSADPSASAWEADIDLTTRFLTDNGQAVFFDEDRTLTLVDIATAERRLRVNLPSDESSPVRSLRLRRRGGWLLVEVDRSNPVLDRVRGASPVSDDPLLSGELHCLDPQTGVSPWGAPVIVDGMALVETAASDAPLLLLARKRAADVGGANGAATGGEEAQIALTVLDLATGATVFRNHEIPVGDEQESEAEFWAVYERGASESLLVRAGRAWVTLETTSLPAPPRPRMLAGVEDPEASRLNGPDDIGRGVERLFQSFWEGDDD